MPDLGLIKPLWLRALVCGVLLLLAGAIGTYGLARPVAGVIVLPLLVMIIGGISCDIRSTGGLESPLTNATPIVNGSEAAIDVNHPLEVYGNEFG